MAYRGLLVAILLSSALPARPDHTTMCINLPHVKYKTEGHPLRSMGFHLFPDDPRVVNWTFYQEEKLFYYLGSTSDQRRLASMWYEDQHAILGAVPQASLNVFAIKNHNGFLNGWYRVELKLRVNHNNDDMFDCLKMFMLQTRDDHFRRQDIGEFVWDFPTSAVASNNCPPNDASKYMLISCGGASKSEPLVSNMIVMVRDNPSRDGNERSLYPEEAIGLKILPNLKGRRSLNFYIRIPIQDCNQKAAINFIGRFSVDRNCLKDIDPTAKTDFHKVTVTGMELIRTKIPGGADALPVPSQANDLDCVTGHIQPSPGVPGVPFILNLELNDNKIGSWQYLHGCQGDFFAGRCRTNYHDIHMDQSDGIDEGSTGLKETINQNEATEGIIPICERYAKNRVDERFPLYVKPEEFDDKRMPIIHTQEYLKKTTRPCHELYDGQPGCTNTRIVLGASRRMSSSGRASRIRKSGPRGHKKNRTYIHARNARRRGRQLVETGKGSIDVNALSAWNNLTEVEKGLLGVPFSSNGFTQLVWGMKQGHGLILAIILFFIMPVNLFITRYYKESFMNVRLLYSRVWYQVHVHGVLITGALLLTSVIPIMTAKRYLGYSITTAAAWHRGLGWTAITLFALMALFGGFRGYKDPLRKCSIFLHWLTGMIFYVLMYGLMLNGLFIPGNGIAVADPSRLLLMNDFDAVYSNPAFAHVFIWILFEIFMHMIMTCNMIVADKAMEVTASRIYLPVPIPVIKEHSTQNASGHALRVVCLAVYIAVAFLSTIVFAILNIKSHNWEGKGLGPMSCTHDPVTLLLLTNLTDECTS